MVTSMHAVVSRETDRTTIMFCLFTVLFVFVYNNNPDRNMNIQVCLNCFFVKLLLFIDITHLHLSYFILFSEGFGPENYFLIFYPMLKNNYSSITHCLLLPDE